MGIHHVQLAMPPGREADAERFYADVLGFDRVTKPPRLAVRGGCWFRAGHAEVHLGVEEGFRPAKKAHPALLVEGLDGVAERLEGSGHAIEPDAPLDGHRRLYTADPFGNRIELIERDRR